MQNSFFIVTGICFLPHTGKATHRPYRQERRFGCIAHAGCHGLRKSAKRADTFSQVCRGIQNSFEEHLTEAALSMANHDGTASLHLRYPNTSRFSWNCGKRWKKKFPAFQSCLFHRFFYPESFNRHDCVDLDNNPFRKK